LLAACGGGSSTDTAAGTGTTSTSTSSTGTASTGSTGASTGTASTSTTPSTGTASTSTTTTATPGGHAAPTPSARAIVARNGGFRTILPPGFASHSGGEQSIEYWMTRSNGGGRPTQLIVFRAIARKGLAAIARLALQHLKEQPAIVPKAYDISSLQPLEIDGQPALAVDYKVASHKPSVRRQVFVIDGEWTYEISVSAAPTQFAASLSALDEVIHNWRWQ
jgi:hypothetical protein